MPACASPGDRVARDDGDGDRQEQRQHDRQRGQRVQRAVAQHRGQERRPLPRPRRQVGEQPAAPRPAIGSALRTAIVAHVRGRRNILRSSTAITGGASTRSVLVPAAASTTSSSVGRSSASPVTGMPGADQQRVDLGRVGAADDDPLAVDRR